MARPFKHEISKLIDEGREKEARKLLQQALLEGGGTFVGASHVLGASQMTIYRWVRVLGVSSSYDGRAGAFAKHEKHRRAAEAS